MEIEMPDTPLTIRQVADAMAVLTIEIVAAMTKDREVAEDRLEDIAGRLMEFSAGMPAGNTRALVTAVGEMLIGTEEGSVPDGWRP